MNAVGNGWVQRAVIWQRRHQIMTEAIKLMELTVDVALRSTEDTSGKLEIDVNLVAAT